jgi:hypothetical protein
MTLPSTPEELARRIVALDRELMQIDREIQQCAAESPELDALLDRRKTARDERVRLQFFVGDGPSAGHRLQDPDRLELPAGRPGSGKPVAVLLLMAATAAGGYLLLVRSGNEPPTPTVETAVAPGTATAPPLPSPSPGTVASADLPGASWPASGASEEPANRDAASTSGREVEVEWRAKVRSAQGAALAPQTPCTLQAKLRLAGEGQIAVEPRIACGPKTLYAWSEASAAGPSRRSARVWERSGGTTAEWEHWLQYSDLDTAAPVLQVKIDTPAQRIVLWRDGQPAVRVELEVEPWAKRRGEPLLAEPLVTPEGFEPIERKGKVTQASGQPPQPMGTPCSFLLVPHAGSHKCRAIVRCSNTIVYGEEGQGYLDCAFVDGLPSTARDTSDTDGDPAFDMDLPARKLVIGSSRPAGGYGMTVQLEP